MKRTRFHKFTIKTKQTNMTTTNVPEAPLEEVEYDTIVVGSGMGGLAVASLLSQCQENHRVLVLEQNPYHAGGCCQAFEREGYRFGVGVHFVGGMEEKCLERKMMDALSLKDDPIEWTPMKDLGAYLIGKDELKTFKVSTSHYKEDLIQQFPDEKEAVEKLFTMSREAAKCFHRASAFKSIPRSVSSFLVNTGLDRLLNMGYHKYAKMTVGEVLRSLTTNSDLQKIVGGVSTCFGMTPDELPFVLLALFLAKENISYFYPTGGPGIIPEKISRVITAGGGEVRVNAKVQKILVEKGRAIGVELVDGKTLRAKDNVISDAGFVKTFRQFVPAEHQPSRRMRAASKAPLENGMTGMVLYVGLMGTYDDDLNLPSTLMVENPDMDLLPDTLDSLAAKNAEDLSLYITCPSAKDSCWKRDFPGKTTLEILVMHAPWNAFKDLVDESGELKEAKKEAYEQFKHDFGQKIWARSRQALISAGASETLPKLLDEADFAEMGTPLTFHRFLSSDRGAWYGLEHNTARFSPRNYYLRLRPECDIAGLFLTGEDVFIDGVLGAMFGAYLCAAKILGVRNPLDLADMVATNNKKDRA